jgi:hypothetical protein
MGRRKTGEPMKARLDARIDPELLEEVRAHVPHEAKTLTEAVESGLRLWLKAIHRKPRE